MSISLTVRLKNIFFPNGEIKFSLQQKRSSAESASPQLVSTKSKRIVVLQEPEETKLNAGMLKEWTGGDSITGRGLYEKKPISFKPQFKLFIVSNHLPQLPADDGGIWRRVKNIKFISTFTDNPDPNHVQWC